ncbi:MAG: photosystem P840 reaction-center cytochrome c-551 [Acidobacteriia bacterium]|nr:photosystem P840 reaction-center cytochrome c-551 [Terriglobia bacterium]
MKKLILILMMALMPLLLAAQQSNVVLPQDKGPDKIDVSAYPAALQANYKLFASKCSKCHTIARPMNTMMKRDEWQRYVSRMMHKPNSGISDSQGKQIFDFLVFDQTERKDKNPKAFFPALSDEEIDKLKKK